MTLAALLAELGRAGVTLRNTDGGVGFSPRSALTPDRAAAVARYKATVLSLLSNGHTTANEDAVYVFEERLGIADELGIPMDRGAPAWLTAVGESLGISCPWATHGVE